jgi:Xaa-Pro aminopeptidase
MNEKIRWLRNKIKSLDLDAMIVSNPINIKYLTGIEAEGTLILARKENFFFVSLGTFADSWNFTFARL